MAKTFTRLGKQIAIAVKAGGPEPENNPTLRSVIATCKRENMPKDNIERAIKNAMGKDPSAFSILFAIGDRIGPRTGPKAAA